MKDLKRDTIWNLTSFGVQALAGACLNLALIYFKGAEGLGVFNQFYAIFVVCGQLFSFGIQDSLQRYLCHEIKRHDLIEMAAIRNSSRSFFITVIGMIIFYFMAGPFLKSETIKQGFAVLVFAIALFQFNKVLIAAYIGRKDFKTYAISQALRAILLVIFVLLIIIFKIKNSYLAVPFLLTEFLILVMLGKNKITFQRFKTASLKIKVWEKTHWNFGFRSLGQNLLTETFIRIDILILSLFFDDRSIGIYSFSAFFFEGIFQIPYLFRVITNPVLVGLVKRKNITDIVNELKKTMFLSFFFTVLAIVCTILLYPYIFKLMGLQNEVVSVKILTILLGGLVIHSIFSPIDNILLQGGMPGIQSLYMSFLSALNVILNFCLIPYFGLLGAAIATSISFALSGPIVITFFYYFFRVKEWSSEVLVSGH